MQLTINSTEDLGYIQLEDGSEVPCRIWEGTTAAGTRCLLFVPRIAVAAADADSGEFAELADASDVTTVKDMRQ
jgi:hypothetical protein